MGGHSVRLRWAQDRERHQGSGADQKSSGEFLGSKPEFIFDHPPAVATRTPQMGTLELLEYLISESRLYTSKKIMTMDGWIAKFTF